MIGIELDYSFMAEMVDNISLYDNGYAFINDEEGNIVYHPRMNAHLSKPVEPEHLYRTLGELIYEAENR